MKRKKKEPKETTKRYVVDSGRNQLLRFQFIGDFPSSIEDVRHFNRVFEIIDEASTSMEVVAGKLQAGTRDGPFQVFFSLNPNPPAFIHIEVPDGVPRFSL